MRPPGICRPRGLADQADQVELILAQARGQRAGQKKSCRPVAFCRNLAVSGMCNRLK